MNIDDRSVCATPFLVKANIDLACAAEFVAHAATNAEAEQMATEVLDRAVFRISTDTASGQDVFVSIPDYSIDSAVVEVEPLQPGWHFDSEAVQANVVAAMGALIFKEIERLEQSRSQEDHHETIRSAFFDAMSNELCEQLWGIYTNSAQATRSIKRQEPT
jgi:hypothetical protein